MSAFNRYIVFLVLAASIINIMFAFTRQNDLTVYFTVNVIAYLVLTVLHAYLNPGARKALSTVAIVLFGCFLMIVIIKTVDVVSGK